MNINLKINEEFKVFNFDKVAKELFKQSFFLNSEREYFGKGEKISTSRFALDCREALSNSEFSRYIYERISSYLDKRGYTTLAVKGVGGIFAGCGVTQYGKQKNLLVVRDERKEYGYRAIVEGKARDNQPVCIVDDLLNNGDSVKDLVDVLRAEGYNVDRSLCIFKFDSGKQVPIDNFVYDCIINIVETKTDPLKIKKTKQ